MGSNDHEVGDAPATEPWLEEFHRRRGERYLEVERDFWEAAWGGIADEARAQQRADGFMQMVRGIARISGDQAREMARAAAEMAANDDSGTMGGTI